jgi:hypothetical protein
MSKAHGLPCVWIECTWGDKCRNPRCIWIHSWQKAEFRAASLPWDIKHYYNEDLSPPHAFEMPLMGSALPFSQATNRNGWRSPKPSHIEQMYGDEARITRPTNVVPGYDTTLVSQSSARMQGIYTLPGTKALRPLPPRPQANTPKVKAKSASELLAQQSNKFSALNPVVDSAQMAKPVVMRLSDPCWTQDHRDLFDHLCSRQWSTYKGLSHENIDGCVVDQEVIKDLDSDELIAHMVMAVVSYFPSQPFQTTY